MKRGIFLCSIQCVWRGKPPPVHLTSLHVGNALLQCTSCAACCSCSCSKQHLFEHHALRGQAQATLCTLTSLHARKTSGCVLGSTCSCARQLTLVRKVAHDCALRLHAAYPRVACGACSCEKGSVLSRAAQICHQRRLIPHAWVRLVKVHFEVECAEKRDVLSTKGRMHLKMGRQHN